MFIFPCNEKNECHAGANGTISHVEGWKSYFAPAALSEIKIDKINDLMARRQEAVREISCNATKNQPKCNLAGQRVRIEVVPREEQCDKRQQRDERKSAIVTAKQTPCRTGVAPVNEFKKTVHDDFFTAFREGIKHNPLGELVKREHNQCERCDMTV